MKRHLNIIIVALLLASWLPRASAQRKLKSDNQIKYSASNVFIGVKGEVASSFYEYKALTAEKTGIPIALNFGLTLEWRVMDRFSIGLDAVHATRKARLSFNTPYLTSYSTTATTNISFAVSERSFDLSLPVTVYLSKARPWLDVYVRPFVLVAPNVFVPYGGSVKWTRTHLVDNTVLDSYEKPLSKATTSDYDYGAKAGIGMIIKQTTSHYYFLTKVTLSVYYGVFNTFSEKEISSAAHPTSPTVQFYGLGDILHEKLGQRYYRQVSLSCSFSLPFRKKPCGACRELGKY